MFLMVATGVMLESASSDARGFSESDLEDYTTGRVEWESKPGVDGSTLGK
jgi:hypothetical protein